MKSLSFCTSSAYVLLFFGALCHCVQHASLPYLMILRLFCPPESSKHRLVFDVGGNKGYTLPRYAFLYSNLDVALVKESIKHLQSKTHYWFDNAGFEIHVFEPTRSAFTVLKELKTAVPLFNETLHLHRIGVSDKEGNENFYIPYNNIGDEGGAMSAVGKLPGLPTALVESVPISTLDIFYQNNIKPRMGDSQRIEFIKVDTEGFDALVIKGMKALLQKRLVRAFEWVLSLFTVHPPVLATLLGVWVWLALTWRRRPGTLGARAARGGCSATAYLAS